MWVDVYAFNKNKCKEKKNTQSGPQWSTGLLGKIIMIIIIIKLYFFFSRKMFFPSQNDIVQFVVLFILFWFSFEHTNVADHLLTMI